MTRKAIVVAVEGLGTNFLGCYGGSIGDTPQLNAMAAHGIVIDQCWLDSLSLRQIYRSLWSGRHAAAPDGDGISGTLPGLLEFQKIASLLVSDNADILGWEGAESFTRAIEVDHDPLERTDDWMETQFAKLFEAALGAWSDSDQLAPLLWIHAKGLRSTWDAPYAWRKRLCDEDDPDPPDALGPPVFFVYDETDPDIVFGWNQSAAAQVMVLDHAWVWLDSLIDELGIRDECLVALIGLGGYPLGEHGQIGCEKLDLFGERLHVPLILQPGSMLPIGQRCDQIVQPASLWTTLLNWLLPDDHSLTMARNISRASQTLIPCPAPRSPGRWPRVGQTALAIEGQQMCLRTPSWMVRWPDVADGESSREDNQQPNVYVCPDDRWQQNDVVSLVPHVIEQVTKTRDDLIAWFNAELPTADPPAIDDLLVQPAQ